MLKRILIIFMLAATPFAAHADDRSLQAPSTDTSQSPAGTGASSSGLGPDTSGSSGGSNGDATTLQPAGGSPLQSTTSDSTGLTAPTAQALQAPSTGSDTLQVLAGDADGQTHEIASTSPSLWGWLWASLFIALIVASGAAILPQSKRFARIKQRMRRRPH